MNSRKRLYLPLLFAGVLLPLWWFGSLAEEVLEDGLLPFDTPLLLLLHRHAAPWLDTWMYWITNAGSAAVLVPFNLLVLWILYRRGQRGAAWFWLLATAGAALLTFLCKQGFARSRPALWVSSLPETTYSFPSGHAMQSMAVACALLWLAWRTPWKWLVLALGLLFVALVGLSRLYWGVHYPSDVLAGWAASLAWVSGVWMGLNLHAQRAG